MALPPYNNARGAAVLTGVPPFDFDGVVMRVFPLKANVHTLGRFCNQYLNLMPPEIAVFKPAIPFVFLAAINYGKMTPEATNLGWVAQNEVAFNVLLNWYRRENGRLVFQDWASVSPFIFVDDESSLMTGREVYGWPKTRAWLTPGIHEWARNPRGPENLFELSSMVFPELFAGQRQEPRVLFEIEHLPTPSVTGPDPLAVAGPWWGWAEAMARGAGLAGDLAQAAMRMPLGGYEPDGEWQSLPEMLERGVDYSDLLSRLPTFNTINLKQFRDARDAAAACYQAITASPMKIARYNDGGMLGELQQLAGDLSGGHRIRVHRYPVQPIVESLGLEVAEQSRASDHEVALLEPVCPFWVNLDMNYGRGRLVCWRTSEVDWRTEPLPEAPATPREEPRKHPYNSARGGALQSVTGPFYFPNVTHRVLPLLADWFRLHRFCAEYLDNEFSFFEPWGSYVYLNVTTFEEMASETYNVGWWAHRQVTFSFPVKWFQRRPGGDPAEREGTLVGVALVTPFAYTDSDLGATTGREVQGLPMLKAAIESPPSSWLEDSGPARRSELLHLSTRVFAGLNVGQPMEDRLLLELSRRDVLPAHDERGWRSVAATWGERLYAELYRRIGVRSKHGDDFRAARALALELLRGEGQPINELSLRQFRDVEDPERACYQALTLTRTTVQELFELAEIEERMHVAIHRYPTQPIVQTLGLRTKCTDTAGSSVVDYLQPVRPFWMRVAMRVDLGEDVFWRAASESWTPASEDWRTPVEELPPPYRAPAPASSSPRRFYLVGHGPEVGAGLVGQIDGDDSMKRDLRAAWRDWRWRPYFDDKGLLGRQVARRAVGEVPHDAHRLGSAPAVVEPQMVLESLLSHEWGRRDRPRGGEHRLPEICLPSSSLGNAAVRERFGAKFGLEEREGFWYRRRWEDTLAAVRRRLERGRDPAAGPGRPRRGSRLPGGGGEPGGGEDEDEA